VVAVPLKNQTARQLLNSLSSGAPTSSYFPELMQVRNE